MIKIKNICLKMLLLTMSIMVINNSSYCLAGVAKPLIVSYKKAIILEISATGTNRINFGQHRIIKLVGDTNYFSSVVSDDGKNLFLTTKLGAVRPSVDNTPTASLLDTTEEGAKTKLDEEQQYINISAITASGDVFDLTLKIVNSLKPNLIELSFADTDVVNFSQKRQIAAKQMIVDMINSNAGKYYVLPIDKNSNTKQAFLEFGGGQLAAYLIKAYRYGDLIGYELKLENKSANWQMIDVTAIKKALPNLKAIKLASHSLLAKKTTQIWVVTKDQGGVQ